MLKQIDIGHFGSFSNFSWQDFVRDGGNSIEFKLLNILYGRNYSGKTNLSRIIRSFETGQLPKNFENPKFSVTTDRGKYDQSNLQQHNLDIRVYNTDFVTENLSFLHDQSGGAIKTFAVLGGHNKEIEDSIALKENELNGSNGLREKLSQEQSILLDVEAKAKEEREKYDELLRNHARSVKNDTEYGAPNYDIRGVKLDMDKIKGNSFQILDGSEVDQSHQTLKEIPLDPIEHIPDFTSTFSTLLKNAKIVLEKSVAPTKPIKALQEDEELQKWVRAGVDLHKNKRESCGFCSEDLPWTLWEKLDAHFNQEFIELEIALCSQIEEVEKEAYRKVELVHETHFYSQFRPEYISIKDQINDRCDAYRGAAKELRDALHRRKQNPFKDSEVPKCHDESASIQSLIVKINTLIDKNEAFTKNLSQSQKKAKEALLLSDIASFMQVNDVLDRERQVVQLEQEVNRLRNEIASISESEQETQEKIKHLQTELQDETKGAEKVNDYLKYAVGHAGLRLEATEETDTSLYKFQVMRGSKPAYDMSEGECSLIAFCYFIARLDDVDTKDKRPIIYIDDPVSSLDSNHIFLVFSLIESIVSKSNKKEDDLDRYLYRQLFISTHNLDFLRYVKRLSGTSKNTQFLLVERSADTSSIRRMPRYLQKFQTEFHYLFEQLCFCSEGQGAEDNHERYFNFGNNLRKLLESYLFNKYPYIDEKYTLKSLVCKFFDKDTIAAALTNRVCNELSHLQTSSDRSMRPFDLPEIKKVANIVLDRMKEKDSEQFTALSESLGQ